MKIILVAAALVGTGWVVKESIPDVKRYLRLRAM
jgi:hypothetical protein